MIAAVSCRQLSPHLALALLLVLCLLLPRPVSAATTVQSIAVTTDRLDYVNVPGMNQVTATARVDFAGNGPIDPVRFDWFDPGASIPFRSAYIAPGSIGVGSAGATDAWVAGREGVGFTVVASINITAGGGPIAASAPAAFNVYNRTQIIV